MGASQPDVGFLLQKHLSVSIGGVTCTHYDRPHTVCDTAAVSHMVYYVVFSRLRHVVIIVTCLAQSFTCR